MKNSVIFLTLPGLHADHLDVTITRWLPLSVASQHAACSRLNIDGVGLPVSAPELSVDPSDLDDA